MKGELEKLKPLLSNITCPIVIVHATEDMLVPVENVEYMQGQFAEGVVKETIILEGKNHFLPWNSEAEVRRAIRVVTEFEVETR